MGFRDLTCFNRALLAKQFWRLWNTKESLASQIIQAKYYPNNSILGAKLGSKPSFAWRSIHGAGEIVRDGLIWRIGDGKSVNIWRDRWIPTPSTFMIQSPPKILSRDANVRELIDQDTHRWNKSLVDNIFIKTESVTTQSIPVSNTNRQDIQIWRGTLNGVFFCEECLSPCKGERRWSVSREFT